MTVWAASIGNAVEIIHEVSMTLRPQRPTWPLAEPPARTTNTGTRGLRNCAPTTLASIFDLGLDCRSEILRNAEHQLP